MRTQTKSRARWVRDLYRTEKERRILLRPDWLTSLTTTHGLPNQQKRYAGVPRRGWDPFNSSAAAGPGSQSESFLAEESGGR
jgi:hypothetical protein